MTEKSGSLWSLNESKIKASPTASNSITTDASQCPTPPSPCDQLGYTAHHREILSAGGLARAQQRIPPSARPPDRQTDRARPCQGFYPLRGIRSNKRVILQKRNPRVMGLWRHLIHHLPILCGVIQPTGGRPLHQHSLGGPGQRRVSGQAVS